MRIDQATRKELKRVFQDKISKDKERAIVVSPHKLTSVDIDLIMKHIGSKKKTADIQFEIDPSLMAGVMVRIGSKVYDFSLKGKLQNLKQSMYEAI